MLDSKIPPKILLFSIEINLIKDKEDAKRDLPGYYIMIEKVKLSEF
ncbi:hypothetical protein [Clostridium sp. USBA 49]|nr:hypothetical protein [Clostridium sp. USBA 49]